MAHQEEDDNSAFEMSVSLSREDTAVELSRMESASQYRPAAEPMITQKQLQDTIRRELNGSLNNLTQEGNLYMQVNRIALILNILNFIAVFVCTFFIRKHVVMVSLPWMETSGTFGSEMRELYACPALFTPVIAVVPILENLFIKYFPGEMSKYINDGVNPVRLFTSAIVSTAVTLQLALMMGVDSVVSLFFIGLVVFLSYEFMMVHDVMNFDFCRIDQIRLVRFFAFFCNLVAWLLIAPYWVTRATGVSWAIGILQIGLQLLHIFVWISGGGSNQLEANDRELGFFVVGFMQRIAICWLVFGVLL